jgi:hypothetical protein
MAQMAEVVGSAPGSNAHTFAPNPSLEMWTVNEIFCMSYSRGARFDELHRSPCR